MCRCCGCFQFIAKQHGEISSLNLICMKTSSLTSLETRATPRILHNQTWFQHSILETIFNKQLYSARIVVENNFGILKKIFRELMTKSNFDVHFFPNVVMCCYMLHNMILNGKNADIYELMPQVEVENVVKNRRCVLVVRHVVD
jgi:hypothetical protein